MYEPLETSPVTTYGNTSEIPGHVPEVLKSKGLKVFNMHVQKYMEIRAA
jgi:hypothetical protein